MFNLVNMGTLLTKDKKTYYFIDILVRDEVSHRVFTTRVFVSKVVYDHLVTILKTNLDMFTFDIERYLTYGFNFKNECQLKFYEELFLADLT